MHPGPAGRPTPRRTSAWTPTPTAWPGEEDAQLLNFPTQPYHHDRPDRILLPWDTDDLPVKVRDYLPKF